jgi:hypothetical protein
MEKSKFKLGDVLQLESEINGFVNQETGERIYEGFLKQNLTIILNYELTELSEVLSKERRKVDGLRDDLIKKHGEEDEKGGILVKMFNEVKDDEGNVISKVINPKYVEFDKEYGELLNTEIDLEYPEITKEDLKEAGKSKDKYQVLFRLIKKETKE